MASIQLINRVYNLLGREHQDSSNSDDWGQIISDTIDSKIKLLLESNIWSFALKYKKLGRKTKNDNPYYNYEYELPVDCIKVLEVYKPFNTNNTTKISREISSYLFEILGNSLYTNIDEILVKYKIDNVSMNQIPQAFIEALAYLSASEVALTLLENSNLSKMFYMEAKNYKNIARANDTQTGWNRKFNQFRNSY